MIAQAVISAFGPFLDDPGGIIPPDARNPQPEPYDPSQEPQPDHGFLDDSAIPSDLTQACIIAVIDDAIPFAHESFRLTGNYSRVAAFWAQDAAFSADGVPGADLPFGIEWRGTGIDRLLARLASGDLPDEDALYRAAGVLDFARPSHPSAAYDRGHGAAVATMAAGFGTDDPAARNFPLIAVSLPPKVIEDSMGTSSPPYLMAGIVFIIQRARRLCRFIETRRGLTPGSLRLPVVINISYGLTAGPRDGSSLFERFMDAVSADDPPDLGPVRFVLPIGNHRQAMLVGVLAPGEGVGWRLPPDDQTPNAVEIWGPDLPERPDAPLKVHVSGPNIPAAVTNFTEEGQVAVLVDNANREVARAYYTPHRYSRPERWREGITIITMPTCPGEPDGHYAPSGDWHIRIDAGAQPGKYEISVQRDEIIPGFHREARQSMLIDPDYEPLMENGFVRREDPVPPHARVRRSGTISAYCGGAEVIRIGAVEGTDIAPARRASIYSGHLRDNDNGDVQAIADRSADAAGVLVCGRNSGSRWLCSGTSIASPQITRWLAGEMAAGNRPTDRPAVIDLARDAQGILPPPPGPPIPVIIDQLPEV